MRRGKGLFSLFPLPIVPRALSFPFSPVSLRHKEVFAEEGGVRGGGGLEGVLSPHSRPFFATNPYPELLSSFS